MRIRLRDIKQIYLFLQITMTHVCLCAQRYSYNLGWKNAEKHFQLKIIFSDPVNLLWPILTLSGFITQQTKLKEKTGGCAGFSACSALKSFALQIQLRILCATIGLLDAPESGFLLCPAKLWKHGKAV